MAESKSGLILAATWSGDPREEDIAGTGGIAIPMLQAETGRLAYHQGSQVRIRKPGRWLELTQNLDGRQGCWVRHQRTIDEVLDTPVPEQ